MAHVATVGLQGAGRLLTSAGWTLCRRPRQLGTTVLKVIRALGLRLTVAA